MTKSAFIILIIAVLISAVGIVSIYSSTWGKEGEAWQDIYKRQLLWVCIGIALFFAAYQTDYRRLWDWTYLVFGAAVFFLLLVFVLGITRLGAQRWLKIGAFNFQPSELAKLAVIIYLAHYFSKGARGTLSSAQNSGLIKNLLVPLAFVLIPVGLIVEQPDLGSGILVLLICLAMFFFAQVPWWHLVTLVLLFAVPSPLVWHMLRDYQKERLLVFINPNMDPLGAGYTIIQSKIAIGSGGLIGKGWLAGTQSQLHFLPESHTDFIFATFTEQWGLLGSGILLVAYLMLVVQVFLIGQRTSDVFGRLLSGGIMFSLGIQVFINVAMNMGLAPVVGIPLPLLSYGGSSVLVTFLSLGIVASISKRRTVF